ncbi:MAG: hypothetical protein N2450_06540 [bacterium]|nr:hypothetical protein [bacterium]
MLLSIRDEEILELAKAYGIQFPSEAEKELLGCVRTRMLTMMPAQAIAFCWYEYLQRKNK